MVSRWSAVTTNGVRSRNYSHVFLQVSALWTQPDRTPKAGVGSSDLPRRTVLVLVKGCPLRGSAGHRTSLWVERVSRRSGAPPARVLAGHGLVDRCGLARFALLALVAWFGSGARRGARLRRSASCVRRVIGAIRAPGRCRSVQVSAGAPPPCRNPIAQSLHEPQGASSAVSRHINARAPARGRQKRLHEPDARQTARSCRER